jgi:hypothetical protein
MTIDSKNKHMQLNTDINTNIIFIGNSRTAFHIDTNLFKKNGISIYNYGVSDRNIYNYMSMSKNALKTDTKFIIISLKISDIFLSEMPKINSTLLPDILGMLKTNQQLSDIQKAFLEYISKSYSLFLYSEVINIKLSNIYNKFNNIKKKNIITNKKAPLDIKTERIDCTIFDIKYPSEDRVVTKCTNGDGILFGTRVSDVNETKVFKTLNNDYIKLLNHILISIQSKQVIPIIVFEPIYKENYTYDIEKVKQHIEANIIDLTKLKLSENLWSDYNHLGNKGRKIYSDILIQKLKKSNKIIKVKNDK